MSNQREFTRYLYDIKHVRYSLLTTLVANTQSENVYKHCIFYTSEYYYSRPSDELWDFLFKVYYDFFIVHNPSFEKTMISRRKRFQKNKDNGLILFVIHNLFNFKSYEGLFILNRVIHQKLKKEKFEYKEYMKEWPIHKTKHTNTELGFIDSLTSKNIIQSVKYCRKLYETKPKKVVSILEKFINKKIKITHSYGLEKCIYEIYKTFDETKYEKTRLAKPNIKYLNLFVNLNNAESLRNWQVLSKKRRGLCKNIGCFSDVFQQTKSDLYNWENFIMHSPIWKDRYLENGAEYDKETNAFVFKKYEHKIKFQNKYDYEIDEQKNYTRNHSCFEISNITLFDWLSKTFWNNKTNEYEYFKHQLKSKIQY